MVGNRRSNEFTEKVREQSEILSVVSRYVALTQRGFRYWGCCPFHHEKTPSFSVDPAKGFFYCFGCHAGGNVFNFLSMIENISYSEAIKLQAERLGITDPLANYKKRPEDIKREREINELININEMARNFFHNCLTITDYGKDALKYLESRQIKEDTIKTFKIGFAPDSWDKLSTAFMKRGIKPEQLIAAGLASPRKNSGIYDRFRNRVMIPITNTSGRVVAFGGRVLDNNLSVKLNYNNPKYLNTTETLIFSKRNLLFGLDRASSEILKLGYSIVVEGYMDVIALYSAGIKNVVATLGTAFTEEHAKLLIRYAKKVYFCYDSDEAGQAATLRALPIIAKAGAQVSIIVVSDGKDPDEFIRKHGSEQFRQLIKAATPFIDYQINYVLSHIEHTTVDGKINALNEILPVVVGIRDAAKVSEYRQKIASALMLEIGVVAEEWDKFSKNPRSQPEFNQPLKVSTPSKPKKNINKNQDNSYWEASRIILKMAWFNSDILMHFTSILPEEFFAKVHQEIINYLKQCRENDKPADDLSASEQLSEEALAEVSKILVGSESEQRESEIQAYNDSMRTLKLKWLQTRYTRLAEETKQYISGGEQFYLDKMRESQKIKKEMDELKIVEEKQ